ncbi:hypothetical protein C1645_827181 [Glomus cerebriforme]|uniref:Uncharacterized protein n=1 Tax=Glomus cerebriforme TaxID=658196 RepID=A0A397SUZ0_9GLOM|nr:hypothetical protein C1645_827181 [Glomus cerebriforme]
MEYVDGGTLPLKLFEEISINLLGITNITWHTIWVVLIPVMYWFIRMSSNWWTLLSKRIEEASKSQSNYLVVLRTVESMNHIIKIEANSGSFLCQLHSEIELRLKDKAKHSRLKNFTI